MSAQIVWFRRDLRVRDQPALAVLDKHQFERMLAATTP